jgi:signal transduction histidine kinase
MARARPLSWRRRPEVALGWLGTACVVALASGVVLVAGGGEEPPLVASVGATVVVAAVIDPVQRRCERLAARWLHGDRQTPYDVLSRFTGQVRSEASPEQLPERMARLLAEGTASAWAQVWVLVNDRLTLIATHPAGAAADPEPPPLAGLSRSPGHRTVTVGYQGRVLGVLRIQERPGRPLTGVEERLFAGLAAQAGLALHSAQVRAELEDRHRELSARTRELTAARDELVCVQDQERRRLERDIHDGAQQQLVALTINLRLAQTLAVQSRERAIEVLAAQQQGAAAAIDTLRSLSRGVQPQVLREEGLAPALRLVAESSPLPVRLTTSKASDRLHPDTEAALYFCGLEALQNAVKHAQARTAEVRLRVGPRSTELTVADDGTGITTSRSTGTGLANMQDRVAALGGSIRVDSAPGAGTRVVASVPTRMAAPAAGSAGAPAGGRSVGRSVGR